MTTILVTGAAGFIGFHLSRRLLTLGNDVVGLDNLNDYYSVQLKVDRLALLEQQQRFRFVRADIAHRDDMTALFQNENFSRVVHLAAQAGVRYSLENPHAYVDSNLVGFVNILEGCRHSQVPHLIYASSSSVYGANRKIPFSVDDSVDHPVSLYAATKKANELFAHSYSHLYQLPTTGLRFFTVYGPWGRPDMAAFLFTKAISEGRPIDVYNHGRMRRDFTYVDDIVEGIVQVMEKTPQPEPSWTVEEGNPGTSSASYRIYNIGNHQPVELLTFIETIERCTGKKAVKNMLPMQPGDVLETYADVDDLRLDTNFQPNTPLDKGIQEFVDWYHDYYQVTATR